MSLASPLAGVAALTGIHFCDIFYGHTPHLAFSNFYLVFLSEHSEHCPMELKRSVLRPQISLGLSVSFAGVNGQDTDPKAADKELI